MRPSIDSDADRLAGIFQRVTGAAGGADFADDGEDDVFRGDALRQLAVDHRAHVLRFLLDQRLRRQHVLDFRGADAVGERAEGAVRGGVAVAAHDGGAGQGEALLGADDVDDALALVEFVEILDAEILGVLRQRRDLLGRFRIGIGLAAVGGRHVVIDHGERLIGRMHLAPGGAQALEGLRRGHLVHQMAVDIDETGAVRLFVHQMVVPDLVVERTRFRHRRISNTQRLFNAAFAQEKGAERRPLHAFRYGRNFIPWRPPPSPARRRRRLPRCAPSCRAGRAGNRAWRAAPCRGARA